MLSGLFTSTLTQQAIAYEVLAAESNRSNDTATIDRATTFSTYDGNHLAISKLQTLASRLPLSIKTYPHTAPYDTLREQRAIFEGIFTPPTEAVLEVKPNCSSGECTWSPYGSLAICSGVANLTALGDSPLLETLRDTTEKRMRVLFETSNVTAGSAGYGDFYLAISETFPIIIGLLDSPSKVFNGSVTELIVSDSFIAYTDEMVNTSAPFDMAKVKYLEVAFWWCTKTYTTEVTQGQATTVEISTASKAKEYKNTLNVSWDPKFYPCYSTGRCNETYGATEVSLEPPPGLISSDESYTVHLWTDLTASMLLASTMLDSLLLDRTRGVVASNGGGVAKAFGFSLLGDFLATEVPLPEIQLTSVRTVVSNTARSMTNL